LDRVELPRPIFASQAAYGQQFTDAAYWRPYVEAICARHGLAPCSVVRAGLPGSHPVFLVEEHWAVKLYTDMFGGAESFPIERELYRLFACMPQLPTPALIAEGALFEADGGWPWPYIITQVVPGTSLGEVRERVAPADMEQVAAYLGDIVRQLHALPAPDVGRLKPSWEPFLGFLELQRAGCTDNQRRWNALPEILLAQIDAYLPSPEHLVDRSVAPTLMHGDLNADHVLGVWQANHWCPTGIIDFGDARVGDVFYELIALHLGLFGCDKRLLRIFLDRYAPGLDRSPDFVERAMSMTLLHEFAVLRSVFEQFPEARDIRNLADLAALIWDLTVPGLSEVPHDSR
jgi:hygromycin-B 7''-O-kinase